MTLFATPLRQTRAAHRVRAVSVALTVASAVGLVALSPPTQTVAADADPAVTVAWVGDSSDLAQYQPVRDPASKHYDDFKNVAVSVARTSDLVDEAVSVTVTGMPGATRALNDNIGATRALGASFVQAMQCWGDPADPEFYLNCQWGAATLPGAGSSAPDLPYSLGDVRGLEDGFDLPFRAVTGTTYSERRAGIHGGDTELLQVFNPQSTNERTEYVDATGTARFDFGVQSAASQPYLGCGDQGSATGTRCWLVVVPRGVHTSAAAPSCTISKNTRPGSAGVIQLGSPINPNCEYWANRVVVPLDFRPTGSVCPAGSVEQRVVGADSIMAAFSSWQTALCRQSGTAYSLTTSADDLAREQLVTGQAQMAITPRAVTEQTLPATVDAEQLAQTDLAYAPVAVSGVTIAFRSSDSGKIQTDLKLSPRLIAKLLTQSYALESGLYYFSNDPVPGPWKGNPLRLSQDPEFKALNPGAIGWGGEAIILTGPNASDAIAQLWAYVQADEKARDFLAGEPDNVTPDDAGNSGMTLNPYYLPRGHPDAKVPVYVEGSATGSQGGVPRPTLLPQRDRWKNVVWRSVGLTYDDGTPRCLCDAELSTFPKADETLMPQRLDVDGELRYDILQMRPYAQTVEASAQMLFRGDSGSKTFWDTSKLTPSGTYGVYIGNGLANHTAVFMHAYTDLASAAHYRLPTASLQVPNSPGVFVDADAAGMAAALEAQTPTAVAGITVTDPATLPPTAYPLTMVLYAAVNLTTTDDAARGRYADLIEYAVTDGQVPGHSIGQLPEGYLPLSDTLRDQALAAVDTIRAYEVGAAGPAPSPPATMAPAPAAPAATTPPAVTSGEVATSPPADAGGEVPAVDPQTAFAQSAPAVEAATAGDTPAAAVVLGGTLVAGLAGAVAGPFLLRRRVALS